MKVLVAGGGTAGHVFPALALANRLAADGHEVRFAGTAQGQEARLVPEAGFAFETIRGATARARGVGARGDGAARGTALGGRMPAARRGRRRGARHGRLRERPGRAGGAPRAPPARPPRAERGSRPREPHPLAARARGRALLRRGRSVLPGTLEDRRDGQSRPRADPGRPGGPRAPGQGGAVGARPRRRQEDPRRIRGQPGRAPPEPRDRRCRRGSSTATISRSCS